MFSKKIYILSLGPSKNAFNILLTRGDNIFLAIVNNLRPWMQQKSIHKLNFNVFHPISLPVEVELGGTLVINF